MMSIYAIFKGLGGLDGPTPVVMVRRDFLSVGLIIEKNMDVVEKLRSVFVDALMRYMDTKFNEGVA
jgi:hypothetical protein